MQLLRHAHSPPSPATSIEALAVNLPGGKLSLVFAVSGDIAEIRLPQPGQAARADGLWRHTCFEAFVRGPGQQSYYEFNLSPSGAWAAYRFDDRRLGMAHADVPSPIIRTDLAGSQFGMVASIDIVALPEVPSWQAWEVGLSAIIEAQDGTLSYWALAHPDGPPDFHHDACFAAMLPPIG